MFWGIASLVLFVLCQTVSSFITLCRFVFIWNILFYSWWIFCDVIVSSLANYVWPCVCLFFLLVNFCFPSFLELVVLYISHIFALFASASVAKHTIHSFCVFSYSFSCFLSFLSLFSHAIFLGLVLWFFLIVCQWHIIGIFCICKFLLVGLFCICIACALGSGFSPALL